MEELTLEYLKSDKGHDSLQRNEGLIVHIYSKEHKMYWAGLSGYTKDKIHAYCFTLKEAFRLTKDCGPEKGIVFEIFSNKFAPDIDVDSKNYKS